MPAIVPRTHVIAAMMLALWTLAGCSASGDISAHTGLAERITAYYELERQQNWAEAWTYRVPVYRQSVPLERYVSIMSRDAAGWSLKSFTVRRVLKEGNRVRVEMQFTEIPPKGWKQTELAEVSFEDHGVWELVDGKWHAWETGQRAHLSLNAAVVPPNSRLVPDAYVALCAHCGAPQPGR